MADSELTLSRACFSDADAMAGIVFSAWQNAYIGLIDSDYPATISREKYSTVFTGILKDRSQAVFVCRRDNAVVGFASGAIQEGKYDSQLIGLYVHPEEQGNGIGSILLNKMRIHFKEKNCKTMIAWTLLGARNNSFYTKHGGAGTEFKELRIGAKAYPGIGYVFDLLHS